MSFSARSSLSRSVHQTFRSLHTPNYRLYFTGQLISLIGTWMQTTGLAWLVLRLTNSPLALGTITTIQFTPVLFGSLYAGVLADRFNKRHLLLCTQALMLTQAVLLAVLATTGTAQLWQLYLLAGLLGIANAADGPARQAFVSELVERHDLQNAVALNSSLFNSARLLGPALGGITIATLGVAGCFWLNAASFGAVIGALLAMRSDRFFSGVSRRQPGNALQQIGAGLRYALTTPDIALLVILLAMVGTFGYNFSVMLPLIATYVLHVGAVGFGALTSASAAGSLAAALSVAYIGRPTRRVVFTGGVAFSVLLLVLGLSRVWYLTVPILFGVGAAGMLFTTTTNSKMQLVPPPELRGRVMSIYTLLFLGSTPIGSLVIGWLAEHGGVQAAVFEMGALCLLGMGAGALYFQRHRARMLPEDVLHRAQQPVVTAGHGGNGEEAARQATL